jgi:hypothetical protein
MNPFMNPWDAWMRGEHYFGGVALHLCERCQAQYTSDNVCITCQHAALENTRRHVASGAWSDYPTRNHITMLCDGAAAQWKRDADLFVGWRESVRVTLNRIMLNDSFWIEGDTPS